MDRSFLGSYVVVFHHIKSQAWQILHRHLLHFFVTKSLEWWQLVLK